MRYLVKLKPLMPFYFGGEHNFTDDGSQKYYAKSLLFPQQSTILGMIRKQILLKAGVLKTHKRGEWVDSKDKEEAKRLVGDKAFSFDEPIDLGIIKSISEVFLVDEDCNKIVKMPMDEELSPRKIESIQISYEKEKRSYIDLGIDPKSFDSDKFLAPQKTLKKDEIFLSTTIAGNKKQSKEDGFFMKECFLFRGNFSFGFYLELSEDIALDGVVELGGDRSKFLLGMMQKECNEPTFSKKDGFNRIVLTGATLLDEKAKKYCDFILANKNIARALWRFGAKKKITPKTKRVYLLEAGSVLYVNNKEALKKLLDKEHLQKIGMNRYKEL